MKPESATPQKVKYIFQLIAAKRRAVIEETPELARERAWLLDPKGPWKTAEVIILSRMPSTSTVRVVAQEVGK